MSRTPSRELVEKAQRDLGYDANRLVQRHSNRAERLICVFRQHMWRHGDGYKICLNCGKLSEDLRDPRHL